MKIKFITFSSILILIISSNAIIGQESDLKIAKKHFDIGLATIESAETKEDLEGAVKEFEKARSFAMEWADVYYNLGFVLDKLERYIEAIENFQRYVKLAPLADDIEEVESLINKIEFKIIRMKDPKTLKGIWYWSRPKSICSPRLEIKINDGEVEARALYSEEIENYNDTYAERFPKGYTKIGSFVPVIWDDFEMKLSVIDAPYFACMRSIDPEMCPSKATFYLVRKGMNKMEGKLVRTEIFFQELNNPEVLNKEIDVVFERDEQ